MQPFDRDEASIHIDASPEAVYAVVSDVTRTPELSPEIVECRWLDGATGPAVGARFVARNKAGRMTWNNKPIVVVADPGREFAFARSEPFGGTVHWRYRLEPEAGGTRVTEAYTLVRPIGRVGWFIIGTVSGCKDRRGDLARGMAETLQRLKVLVEGSEGAPAPRSGEESAREQTGRGVPA